MYILTRKKVLHIINNSVLTKIKALWGLKSYNTTMHPQYDGCQNLIYYLKSGESEFVLRISFREDRNYEQIQAELHFVNYLHANGALVAYPIKSKKDSFVEAITIDNVTFYCVIFIKAKGFRLVDKHYKYREGISIDEYFHNYGKTLGILHRLTKRYSPINDKIKRPDFTNIMNNFRLPMYLPKDKKIVKEKYELLTKKTNELPKDKDTYGLIHTDFNDGNFVIDYENGNITTFDFDDSAYNWFTNDIADSWVNGFGWAMFENTIEKRKYKMNNWFTKVMNGYTTENTLSETMLSKLPLFIKIAEIEWVMSLFENAVTNNNEIEYDGEMLFKLECIEKDIPYFGLYSKIYNHEKPFCL